MVNPIDYDWQDEKLHKGRLLLGDPIAATIQTVMDYVERINLMNEGLTNYDLRFVLGVYGQKLSITHSRQYIRFLGRNHITMYYPSKSEFDAICLLTDVQTPNMFHSYFEKLRI